jgi:hypothetical protein
LTLEFPQTGTTSPMTAARTLAIALLATLTLTCSSALADDMTAQQKRDYVSSGAYLNDVSAAASPAKAWLDQRSDEIAALTAACTGSGQPVGVAAKAQAKQPRKAGAKAQAKKPPLTKQQRKARAKAKAKAKREAAAKRKRAAAKK